MLPQRLDWVVALTPGILIYESGAEKEAYMAVDEGVLVKTGPEVLVSVRRAMDGMALSLLRDAVEREFLTLGEHEQSLRASTAEMEDEFLRCFSAFQNG